MEGELYHYGVKGMKWGVRKDDGPIDARRSTKKDIKTYEKGTRANSTTEQRARAKEVEDRWRAEKKKTKLDAMTEDRRKSMRKAKRIGKTVALAGVTLLAVSPTAQNAIKSSVENSLRNHASETAAQAFSELTPQLISFTEQLIRSM